MKTFLSLDRKPTTGALLLLFGAIYFLGISVQGQGTALGKIHRYSYQSLPTYGIGLGYQWNPFGTNKNGKAKRAAGVEGNFFLPAKDPYEVPIFSLENGEASTVTITDQYTFMQINAYGKQYLAGTYDNSSFGWYFKGGFGYMVGFAKSKIGNYDKDKFEMFYEEESATASEFMFELGTGIEGRMGSSYFFAEASIFLPPNQTGSGANAQAYNASLGGSATINLGMRFPFGGGGGVRDTRAGAGRGKSVKRARSIRKNRKSYFF